MPTLGGPTASHVVLSTLLLAACSAGPVPQSAWSVTDSAGVTVLTGPPPQNELGVLSEAPLLEISEVDGTPVFRVESVLPQIDGSFFVLDAGNHRVLLFDQEGTLQASSGQQGDGPGEFQAPSVIALAGDSVLVYDRRHRRVTVLGRNLQVVRDQLLEGRDGFGALRFAGATDGSTWVGIEGDLGAGIPSAGILRPPVRYVGIRPDGPPRPIVEGRGSEAWVDVQTEEGQITAVNVMGHPFYRRTLAAIGQGHLVVADSDEWVLSDYGDTGELRRRIRMSSDPDAFGSSTLDEYLSTLVDLTPEERREQKQRFDGVTMPQTLPAFSALFLDDNDQLWAREFNLDAAAEQHWIVFGAAGALGTVRVPARFTVSAVHGGRVWGVYRDELDIESIRVYALEASSVTTESE